MKPKLGSRGWPSAAMLACLLCASVASAAPSKQDMQKADKLFKEARTLMGKGSYGTACPKLEESQKLDPAPGTQFQLAVCYENVGRLATALALYLEVADLAKQAGKADKEKVARDAAAALEPKVARIVIEVPGAQRVSGLVITRDGAKVEESQYGRPILLDPGDATIEANAPGKKPFKSVVTVKGVGTKVTVPIQLEGTAATVEKQPPPPPSSKPFFTAPRIAAVGVAAVGAGGLVAGTIIGLNAKDAYEKAIGDTDLCPSKTACYPEGKRLVDGAQSDALVSTIVFIAGGVAFAGGAVLFVLAPAFSGSEKKGDASTVTVVPVAAPGYGGLAATGTF
jgi:hypothetical protein